jgi:GTP-binding protein Era
LPYCCEVKIESFKEPKPEDKQQVIRISATVCVERDSQKGIVVGKGGAKIKEVGIDARTKLEEFFLHRVFLSLEVKVDKNWRKDEKKLKAYGYLK